MGLVGGGMLKVMQSNEPVDLFLLPGTSAFKYCLIFTTPKIFYTDFSFGTSFYVKCMTVQGQAWSRLLENDMLSVYFSQLVHLFSELKNLTKKNYDF
jgi:hypothetical protein